jgi:hypothetical protein
MVSALRTAAAKSHHKIIDPEKDILRFVYLLMFQRSHGPVLWRYLSLHNDLVAEAQRQICLAKRTFKRALSPYEVKQQNVVRL